MIAFHLPLKKLGPNNNQKTKKKTTHYKTRKKNKLIHTQKKKAAFSHTVGQNELTYHLTSNYKLENTISPLSWKGTAISFLYSHQQVDINKLNIETKTI